MAEGEQSLIIKKVKKVSGGGHSGGAWKVAYADFVTAMMAFFLLLWLLNSVTQEQLEGISNYFAPASVAATKSGSGDILGGTSVSQAIGALNDPTSAPPPSVTMDMPPPKAGSTVAEASDKEIAEEEAAKEAQEKKEEEQFKEAEQKMQEMLDKLPNLKELAGSLIVENTPEGMRIQVVDQDGLAMFPSGGSDMFEHTRKLMKMVAGVVSEMPQQLTITGHTDAQKFAGGSTGAYTNWELSADRANASRRALIELGVDGDRITKVVGAAAYDPLLPDDPKHARNRRIAIVLLRGTGAGNEESTPAQKKKKEEEVYKPPSVISEPEGPSDTNSQAIPPPN